MEDLYWAHSNKPIGVVYMQGDTIHAVLNDDFMDDFREMYTPKDDKGMDYELHPEDQAIASMYDDVDHPKHYTAYKGLEVIQLTEQMNFNRGNAVKYISRAGLKNPSTEIQDLEKAKWYIQREIDRLSNSKED